MNYDIIVEKKITSKMYNMPLKDFIGNMKNPKIIIMGIQSKISKKPNINLKKLIAETNKTGKRFDTSKDFFTYLDS